MCFSLDEVETKEQETLVPETTPTPDVETEEEELVGC